jgi:hypothetical protein
VSRLQDPLPEGNFDLVVSALAAHQLDGAGKADLFARGADRLQAGGRFVLGDGVVLDDPANVVTPIDGVFDQPSTITTRSGGLPPPAFTPKWSGLARILCNHRGFTALIRLPCRRSMVCSTDLDAVIARGGTSQAAIIGLGKDVPSEARRHAG